MLGVILQEAGVRPFISLSLSFLKPATGTEWNKEQGTAGLFHNMTCTFQFKAHFSSLYFQTLGIITQQNNATFHSFIHRNKDFILVRAKEDASSISGTLAHGTGTHSLIGCRVIAGEHAHTTLIPEGKLRIMELLLEQRDSQSAEFVWTSCHDPARRLRLYPVFITSISMCWAHSNNLFLPYIGEAKEKSTCLCQSKTKDLIKDISEDWSIFQYGNTKAERGRLGEL